MTMEERLINQVVGQVMIYDNATKHWLPAGTSSGLSTVRLIHCVTNNTFRIHGQKIDGAKEVVLDNVITMDDKFNLANGCFVRWHDKHAFWGLNFRPKSKGGPDEASSFFESIKQILNIVNQTPGQNQIAMQQQQPQQQTLMGGDPIVGNQHALQQTNSASIIQRPIQPPVQQQQQQQQQVPHQQVVQQTILQQQHQQAQLMNMRMMNDQHQQQTTLMGQGPQAQMMQQNQSSPHLMQQQQLQAQYMHQQQPQSQPNQTQMNHYQPAHHQQHLQQQQHQQQHQIRPPPPQPQMQQQAQIQQPAQPPPPPQPAQVVSAPIPPPPPPPPPPAPPLPGLGNTRMNGISNSHSTTNSISNEVQHSPVSNNTNGQSDRSGTSPNQQISSLANQLSNCQLKKSNLTRSDSERDTECNNNHVGNPKTTRAASVAHVQTNLMTEMANKLESRRKKLDQVGDTQFNCSTNSITNGLSNDKGQESWLSELIRKEISQEMSKMKAEILEAIRSELKQRQ